MKRPDPAVQVNVHVHETGYRELPRSIDAAGTFRSVNVPTHGNESITFNDNRDAGDRSPSGTVDESHVIDDERGLRRSQPRHPERGDDDQDRALDV